MSERSKMSVFFFNNLYLGQHYREKQWLHKTCNTNDTTSLNRNMFSCEFALMSKIKLCFDFTGYLTELLIGCLHQLEVQADVDANLRWDAKCSRCSWRATDKQQIPPLKAAGSMVSCCWTNALIFSWKSFVLSRIQHWRYISTFKE